MQGYLWDLRPSSTVGFAPPSPPQAIPAKSPQAPQMRKRNQGLLSQAFHRGAAYS